MELSVSDKAPNPKSLKKWEDLFKEGKFQSLSAMYLKEASKKTKKTRKSNEDESEEQGPIDVFNEHVFPVLVKNSPKKFIDWMKQEPALRNETLYYELLFQEGLRTGDYEVADYALDNRE